MPDRPPDARTVKSGSALRAALLELLERKPFDQITIREITAAAGVHYTTFFRHHPTKEKLLDHLAADQIDTLVALTLPTLDRDGDQAAVAALFAYVESHRALWTALLTGGAADAMRGELLRISRRLAAEREPDAGRLAELGANYSVSLIFETLAWWLAQPADTALTTHLTAMLRRLLSAVQQRESFKDRTGVPANV